MNSKTQKIGVLVLAAGASRRMGKAKQLLPWKDTTLLGHIIKESAAISDDICVVLGANADKIKTTIPEGIKTILNPDWEMGMGTSISCGVSKFGANQEALLIILTDQPFLGADYFKKMEAAYRTQPDKIIATDYGGKPGVPALFPNRYFRSLERLSQDFGARHLMKQEQPNIVLIDCEGKHMDVDTFRDYEAMLGTE